MTPETPPNETAKRLASIRMAMVCGDFVHPADTSWLFGLTAGLAADWIQLTAERDAARADNERLREHALEIVAHECAKAGELNDAARLVATGIFENVRKAVRNG